MADRLSAFINKDRMEREDVAQLIADDNITIKVYRKPSLGENDGFRETNVNSEPRHFKSIVGRIDRRDRVYNPATNDQSDKVTQTIYVATVYFRGLQKDDILDDGQQKYTVKYINNATSSFTEAEVEVLV